MDTTNQKEPTIITLTGRYLSENIQHLPSGRINKKYTGIGATTLELKDDSRNSVIVVPTRALAATKAKDGVFYIGGPYDDHIGDNIEIIKSEFNNGKNIKIMAVADTFNELFYSNKDFFLNSFHLVIDEIDSFQSESYYRESLHHTLDIFRLYNKDRRTLISATLQTFSEQDFQDLDLYIIEKKDSSPLTLELFHSLGDIEADLAYLINMLIRQNPHEKILVAFNLIAGIKQAIAALGKDLNIGVLCGEKSLLKIPPEYRSYLVNGKLSSQVTFITSAYFVGVDIKENGSVIVVGDPMRDFTAPTKSKIIQVIGRLRNGTNRNIFLFKTNTSKAVIMREFQRSLINTIDSEFLSAKNRIIRLSLADKQLKTWGPQVNIEEIAASSHFNGLKILRKDMDNNQLRKNTLTIDYILQQQEAYNKIYNMPGRTKTYLSKDNYFNARTPIDIKNHLDESAKKRLIEINSNLEKNERKMVIEYIETRVCSFGYLGEAPCPSRYKSLIDNLFITFYHCNECEIIKTLLVDKLNSDISISEFKKFVDIILYLKLWNIEQIAMQLGNLLPDNHLTKNAINDNEIVKLVKSIQERMPESVKNLKIDLSTKNKITMFLKNLFILDKKSKPNHRIIIRRKLIQDYL